MFLESKDSGMDFIQFLFTTDFSALNQLSPLMVMQLLHACTFHAFLYKRKNWRNDAWWQRHAALRHLKYSEAKPMSPDKLMSLMFLLDELVISTLALSGSPW